MPKNVVLLSFSGSAVWGPRPGRVSGPTPGICVTFNAGKPQSRFLAEFTPSASRFLAAPRTIGCRASLGMTGEGLGMTPKSTAKQIPRGVYPERKQIPRSGFWSPVDSTGVPRPDFAPHHYGAGLRSE